MAHSDTYTFENGPNCKGKGTIFGDGETGYSFDMVELRQNYPEIGTWARNNETAFNVMIIKGAVALVIQRANGDFERVELDSTIETPEIPHTFTIPAGEKYRWESATGKTPGNDPDDEWAEIALIGNPPFHGGQYELVQEASDEQ